MKRTLVLVGVGVAVVLGAAYFLLVMRPPHELALAVQRADRCLEEAAVDIEVDPATCRFEAPFTALPSHRRAAAKAVQDTDYQATWIEAKRAARVDLDPAVRDAALRRLWKLAQGHDADPPAVLELARKLGAHEVIIELAREAPTLDWLEGSAAELGVDAALWLGDLEAAAALAEHLEDADLAAAFRCLGGGACKLSTPKSDGIPIVVEALQLDAAKAPDAEVLAKLHGAGSGLDERFDLADWFTNSVWALRERGHDRPDDFARMADALLARAATSATPAPLLDDAWLLRVAAAQASWTEGDEAAARAALDAADRAAADPRQTERRDWITAPLRIQLLPADQALAWLDDRIAHTEGDAALRLAADRGMLLVELDRAAEVLAGLPPTPEDCSSAACRFLDWVRLGAELRSGQPLAVDGHATLVCFGGMNTWWVRDLLAAPDLGDRARFLRWDCKLDDFYEAFDTMPIAYLALGGLVADGQGDREVWLDTIDPSARQRPVRQARELAARWRGDTAAAKVHADRRAKIEAAFAAHPELAAWRSRMGV